MASNDKKDPLINLVDKVRSFLGLPWRLEYRSGPLRSVEAGGRRHQRVITGTPDSRCTMRQQR